MKFLNLLLVFIVFVGLVGCSDNDNSDMRAYNDEPEIMKTSADVEFVRTPDSCFDGLPDWPYEPNYVEIDGLRQAYVDEGSADGQVVLLLHGQPSWSYLYRKMIPVLADAGMRVIAMDHLGMGRSDKPTEITSYSYLGHCDRLQRFIEALDLRDINLFVQDWGSLIGLRVAGLNPDRFARIAVGDGMLPTWPEGVQPFPPVENPNETVAMTSIFEGMPAQQVPFYNGCEPIGGLDDGYFGNWMAYSMKAESFRASEVVEAMTWFDLPADEEAAYDAPFPSRTYMAGPRVFPSLANEVPGTTQEAWAGLTAFQKPFVTIWAANDPGNLGSCQLQNMLACSVAGAKDQPHARLAEASHFLQDDQGAEIARRLVAFIKNDTSVLGNYEPSCGLPITDTSSLELTPTLCDDPNNMEAVLEALQSGEGGGMFGNVNQAQLQRMLAAPTDGPFYMVNLIKYRERAVYADGRETDLTGREANALYAPTEFLQAIGARAVFNTEVHDQIDGDDVLWDDFTVVEYPCPLAFLAMLSTPDFQARAVHKEAGVEKTIVIVTNLLPIPAPADPDQSEAAFPPTTEDPAFDLIHVMDFYDIAQYEPDANEPERTGKEAWQMYQASGQGASTDLGHYSTAALVVQGVFTGDDRTWDEIQIVHMSSMAGFQALLDDDTRVAGRYHRLAALQHNYSMITFPTVSQIPYADGDSGSTGSLPVTSDGTGTICQTDDDCPGDGVNKCLTDGSGVGFCTREGCEIGDCEPPYLCCRDCNPAVAAMLPFEGSACIPGNMVGQLTAAPVSCTCD